MDMQAGTLQPPMMQTVPEMQEMYLAAVGLVQPELGCLQFGYSQGQGTVRQTILEGVLG